MSVVRCPAANPMHRQRAVLPQNTHWSFPFDRTSRPNTLRQLCNGEKNMLTRCRSCSDGLSGWTFAFYLDHTNVNFHVRMILVYLPKARAT